MALTAKQEAFIQEYLIDLNATQAAIRAGYSEKTAEAQASRLLRNVNVREMVDKRRKEIGTRTLITAEEVILGIRKIAEKRDARDSDKLKAFELLGKHLAMFTDKLQHSGEVENKISHDLSSLTMEELDQLEKILAKSS